MSELSDLAGAANDIEDTNSTRNIAARVRGNLGVLNEEEVAAVLHLNSTGTLATWRSQNSGPPYVKLGKRVFYTQSGLASWINAKIQEQDAAKAAA